MPPERRATLAVAQGRATRQQVVALATTTIGLFRREFAFPPSEY